MKTIDRVEQSLKYNHNLRSSDKMLLIHEWEKDGLLLTGEQQAIFISNCTPAESITRARRKLKSKYPATKEVDDKRYDLFQRYRGGEIV